MILSRDGKQSFKVSKPFLKAFNYVNLSENKWAFMQKEDTGTGKRRDSGEFTDYYAYDSVIAMYFQTNFDNFDSPCISELPVFPKLPTYCNYNVAQYCKEYGFTNISDSIKFANWDANELIVHLESNARKVNSPRHIAAFYKSSLTIACQEIPNGIGHVAPVIGKGNDGKIYVANIGAISRDGIVDCEYAFATELKNISFYEVTK